LKLQKKKEDSLLTKEKGKFTKEKIVYIYKRKQARRIIYKRKRKRITYKRKKEYQLQKKNLKQKKRLYLQKKR